MQQKYDAMQQKQGQLEFALKQLSSEREYEAQSRARGEGEWRAGWTKVGKMEQEL